jgi:hypothetical protein
MPLKKINKIKEGMRQALARIKKGITKTVTKKRTKAAPEIKPKKSQVPLQVAVGESKFYLGEQPHKAYQFPQELPWGYGQDKIVLQVRDPWWIHAYWEITSGTLDGLRERLKDAFYSAKRVLRVYDISNIIFKGTNAHRFFDIEIDLHANNWYIDTQGPGRSWCVEFGLRLPNSEFIAVVRSNTVHTPLEGPSWITDEEWMIPEDLFSRLYGMGVGFGSSPVKLKRAWQERIKQELGSGGVSSVSSPALRKVKPKGFWLVVNTELILYGATEPDAKVTVQGRPVSLRSDGTFSLRFALPDGKQVLPVKATSFDGSDDRTITPAVTRETK